MRSKNIVSLIGAVMVSLCIFLAALYQVPAIHERLSWRLDFAAAFVRGVLDPVKPLPTPLAVQAAVEAEDPATPTPTATFSMPEFSPTSGPTATPSNTPTPTPSPTPIPAQAELPPPAWVKQDINNCGPATLTMYLSFYGWKGDQAMISQVIKPLPEDRNVNVEELVYYVRNQAGWLQIEYRVGGNIDLIKKFVAAGIPVMIEEAFPMQESYWPNDDRWAGHYLLITGYDDSAGVFITQDVFVSANLRTAYTEIEKRWETFNHVYMLLFRPDQAGLVQSILGKDWDVNQNRTNALEASRKATQNNPSDAFAWFNLGTNLVYFENYDEAAKAYDRARTLGLPQRMLRYQFGPFIAYFHSLRTDDLMTLTEYALKITPTSEEAMLWRGWGLYRLGRKDEAISFFQKALKAHPGYTDADYALSYVSKN
jgi:tetratricopeptide (TPR) repeat protein